MSHSHANATPMLDRRDDLLQLRPLTEQDAESMTTLRASNRDFFQPFEPRREDEWYTLDSQRADIAAAEQQLLAGRKYYFGIFSAAGNDLVGWVTLSCIERGVWQNCNLGYSVAQSQNGKGIATGAVSAALSIAFKELELHRVQAAVMLHNQASARVLEKNGFRREGLAERYLRLNGEWEDHSIFAITAEEFAVN